jgi:predicted XRE-type DNA-binding protein
MPEENQVEVSSGNVFADLGLSNPEERLLKAELVRKISEIITNLNLTQVQAAEILGIDQPKVSLLIRGRLSGFSTDRLMDYLNKLGSDVEITVKPALHNGGMNFVSRKVAKEQRRKVLDFGFSNFIPQFSNAQLNLNLKIVSLLR